MKIIIPNDELELDDLSSLKDNKQDAAEIRTVGSGLKKGDKKSENRDALTVEMAGLDCLTLPQKEVARIHNLSGPSVHNYQEGKKTGNGAVDLDLKAKILDNRFKIQNVAVTKLMESLNLFDPNACEDQKELMGSASKLAGIVDKISGDSKEKNENKVQIIMYQPRLKSVNDYEVIEVG